MDRLFVVEHIVDIVVDSERLVEVHLVDRNTAVQVHLAEKQDVADLVKDHTVVGRKLEDVADILKKIFFLKY